MKNISHAIHELLCCFACTGNNPEAEDHEAAVQAQLDIGSLSMPTLEEFQVTTIRCFSDCLIWTGGIDKASAGPMRPVQS